jgi:hypothetical protein
VRVQCPMWPIWPPAQPVRECPRRRGQPRRRSGLLKMGHKMGR